MLNNMILGTSFSPEYCEEIGCSKPFDILKIVNKELKITDIRLGIRWNRVETDKKLSLEFYSKYINYLLKNNSNICLNIGPIKVLRWPEEHIPTYLEKYAEKDIKVDSELAKYSYEYLNKLLLLIKKEYGKNTSNLSFQIENEGYNRFGHLGTGMSQEYMIEVCNSLKGSFPSNKLMVNSAGRTNLKKVVSLFSALIQEDIYSGDSLVLALNYYFRFPHTLPFVQKVEPLKYSFPFDMSIKELHSKQKEMNFGLEISEAQLEPWGKQQTPGNLYEDYIYLLEKCNTYFPNDYPKKMIRLWGTEELAFKIFNNTIGEEHKKIIKSIQKVNNLNIFDIIG